MKIEEVESLLIGDAHIVRIHTDSGISGIGQSAQWAYPQATHSIIEAFRKYLIGKDPFQIEYIWVFADEETFEILELGDEAPVFVLKACLTNAVGSLVGLDFHEEPVSACGLVGRSGNPRFTIHIRWR